MVVFITSTAQKMKFSIKDFFSKFDQIRRKLDLVSFTQEILNGKLHFLCNIGNLLEISVSIDLIYSVIVMDVLADVLRSLSISKIKEKSLIFILFLTSRRNTKKKKKLTKYMTQVKFNKTKSLPLWISSEINSRVYCTW